jgi:hypothetical protein
MQGRKEGLEVETYLLCISRLLNSLEDSMKSKPFPLNSHYQNLKNRGTGESTMSLKLACEKIFIDKYESIS